MSIGASVREEESAQSRADFISKFAIALKACDETGYWLELFVRTGYLANEQTKSYRVIESLRRLVTTEEYDGRIVNPSRLVWGTNAVLKEGVGEGSPFEATNVVWSVVSNSPGRVVPIV